MEAALVYPNQLFHPHPAVQPGRLVLLIEDPLVFGNDPRWPLSVHVKKRMLHRASMKAYEAELAEYGHQVRYIDAPETSEISSTDLLESVVPETVRALHLADPVDDVLMTRIRRFAASRGIGLIVHESPNFLTPSDFLHHHTGRPKKPFMARFYEAQRKRMEILIAPDGTPEGGKWSFDPENRAKLPKRHVPPPEPVSSPNRFTREAAEYVKRRFPNSHGTATAFRWPVTRADASAWFERFLDERLENFGLYEDAISTEHATLYHSAITPMLNIGLLDPQDVIRRVLDRRDHVPLNSLEGFIRQVIGWREFMRGIYQHRGPAIRTRNFWNFDRPMPASFYDGTTGIPPVDRVIRQLLADGWCHHIERLMVLGNFMLLCRIRPDDVYRWFMELFIDAYDWVMVPNIYGMSQFADGGTFTTKPYLSGSNYVLKMSDESKGWWCEIWDGLFWTFIADHAEFFLTNPRLSMMARTWMKMPPAKQAAHRRAAEFFLATL
ncbi:MAG: cryptochrome/photolyase family protein [Luteolibacter sp.]|uniref:cryptochrome/photolyase family protein n=1 Tax=Luteolibacter sp. TaxID=1962973 RepID=UPI0032664976